MRESFSTLKDPSVFAAASDVDNTSLIDLFAVKRGTVSCVLMQCDFHRSPRGAQSSYGAACVVAMFESEKR